MPLCVCHHARHRRSGSWRIAQFVFLSPANPARIRSARSHDSSSNRAELLRTLWKVNVAQSRNAGAKATRTGSDAWPSDERNAAPLQSSSPAVKQTGLHS